jgi:hypothetical protein
MKGEIEIKIYFRARRILAKEVKVLYAYFSWKYVIDFKYMDPAYDSKHIQNSSSCRMMFEVSMFSCNLKLLWPWRFFLTDSVCMRALSSRYTLVVPCIMPVMDESYANSLYTII